MIGTQTKCYVTAFVCLISSFDNKTQLQLFSGSRKCQENKYLKINPRASLMSRFLRQRFIIYYVDQTADLEPQRRRCVKEPHRIGDVFLVANCVRPPVCLFARSHFFFLEFKSSYWPSNGFSFSSLARHLSLAFCFVYF